MVEKKHPAEQSFVINQKLQNYLSKSKIVESSDIGGLRNRLIMHPINIMMGQTFDEGQPVDIIKYAVLIMDVQDIFFSSNAQSSASWLIADHFISDINKDEERSKVRRQAQERISYLHNINRIYKGKIDILLSSQLASAPKYQENLTTLLTEKEINENFRNNALKAIPEDRRNKPEALRYPFEEIATIQSMDTDIKIGPVYEKKYDEPARNIASKIGFKDFSPIYITRSYPFGNPNIPEDLKKEIEVYGILPYKKDSKKLSKYRIDPINDTPEQTKELINQTTDIRALIDLLQIADLSRIRLKKEKTYKLNIPLTRGKNIDDLKKLVFKAYMLYIYEPLHNS